MPVYIEHVYPRAAAAARVTRYVDLDDAARAISRDSREPEWEVRAQLQGGTFSLCNDAWRVVSAEEFGELADYYREMQARMSAGEDVEDLHG